MENSTAFQVPLEFFLWTPSWEWEPLR